MIHAYDETYLSDAMSNLAGAVDYAVNDWHMGIDLFLDFFLASPCCPLFERGVPKVVCGMSGQELAMEVMRDTGFVGGLDAPEGEARFEATPEYWCGWVLAYCQWDTGARFEDILGVLAPDELLALYPTLHEADESRVVEVYRRRAESAGREGNSRLHEIRVRAGLSQRELAERSGASLRSVQMYEQRRKDLSKASVATVLSLSRVLGCAIEDLLEP